uniref:Taste receptor type 2 n=1 Tax=Sus scrofa TaxID=9823 RepID=A0A143ZCH5_PIG|nr:Taste receptor type 2, member 1 [Sus scrofa]
MPESHHTGYLLLAVIQFLIGVLVNGTIVVVNGIDLIQRRKLNPLALLISCLAISRIGLQFVLFCATLAGLSLIRFLQLAERPAIFLFVNESGLWFATWLSVFYCAKIATIPHPVFSWLKTRISRLVPWLILGSLVYAFSISVFQSKRKWIFSKEDLLALLSPNATNPFKEMPPLKLAFLSIELGLPLLIFLISVLLLIYSLGRHTQQMRNTVMGPRGPRTRVHVSALLSILVFLGLYICHYTAAVLFFFQIFKLSSLRYFFCLLVVGSYHTGHSVNLILGNPKLKQIGKKLLLHRKCCQ